MFRAAVERFSALEPELIAAAAKLLSIRELKRGEFLLRAGEPATHGGMVARGLLRELYVLKDGPERTKAFIQEGEPTGSLADLLRGGASRAWIVAEEPTRVVLLPFAANMELARFASWRAYQLQLLQLMFLAKAEREYELLGLDAEARYEAFRVRYPGLEARVAARHVATYLGITAVHLSRLRRRRRQA